MGKDYCCLDKSLFSHDMEEVSRALGVSRDEEEAVKRIINEVLRGDGRRMRISEMIEYIWSSKCGELSLNARIYATFRLGMEVYGALIEGVIKSLEGAGGSGRSEAS